MTVNGGTGQLPSHIEVTTACGSRPRMMAHLALSLVKGPVSRRAQTASVITEFKPKEQDNLGQNAIFTGHCPELFGCLIKGEDIDRPEAWAVRPSKRSVTEAIIRGNLQEL